MAFFRQLKLLLWKNGLAVIRQPIWSLTLIAWPLVIFILLAVTRNHFPPIIRDTCYVGPRNLPSAGFFPFLQTLLCNTDSRCSNMSHSADSQESKASRNRRSAELPKNSPLATLFNGGEVFNTAFSSNLNTDPSSLAKYMENIIGSSSREGNYSVSLMSALNSTLHDQETMNKIIESTNILKKAFCSMTLPWIPTTSPNTLGSAVDKFCNTNNTLLEISLQTLNKLLTDMMVTKPEEIISAAGTAVMLFNQLQKETMLWDKLLGLPKLLSSNSVDQSLSDTEALLTNIERFLRSVQNQYPEMADSLSTVHPVLLGGINMIHYAQNWPGKDVSITLGDIVTLKNDSASELVKTVLQNVRIPLDKALGLMLDKDVVHSYLCDNSNNSMLLSAACSMGMVDMLLCQISPSTVTEQVFLAWSKHVAADDVSFVKGLVEMLMGNSSEEQALFNFTRSSWNVDAPPQTAEEQLFVGVGQALLEIAKIHPDMEMVVKRVLGTGFQLMKAVRVTLDPVEGLMENIVEDMQNLKLGFHSLLNNRSELNAWIRRATTSARKMIENFLLVPVRYQPCEKFFQPIEWLLSTESVKKEVWIALLCQDNATLEQTLLMDWKPVVQKANEVYFILTGQAEIRLTLPELLSEWKLFYNDTMQFVQFVERLMTVLDGDFWMDFMPDQGKYDYTDTLLESASMFAVSVGEQLEASCSWPKMKDYFHMIYWVLKYRPDDQIEAPNCTVNACTMALHCDTGLDWPLFVQRMICTLSSPNQEVLVNILKGSGSLLQHLYGDVYRNLTSSYFKENLLPTSLFNLTLNLDDFAHILFGLPNANISNPSVISYLLESSSLKPLLPLIFSEGPVNSSSVLDVVLQIIKLNQDILGFTKTDLAMKQLEQMISQFLDTNMTVSLSDIIGHSLVTYSSSINSQDFDKIKEALMHFTNQSSDTVAAVILTAVDLLEKLMESPESDPREVILSYMNHLQEQVISLYTQQTIEQHLLSSGQLSAQQVKALQKVIMNLINLDQAEPNVTLNRITEMLVAILPLELQKNASYYLQGFKTTLNQMNTCTEGENCMKGISEMFTIFYQVTEFLLAHSGNTSVTLFSSNSVPWKPDQEELAATLFSLVLPPNDTVYMEKFKQTLHFIKLVIAEQTVTVSSVTNVLSQSNLTGPDLDAVATLAGSSNMKDLMMEVMNLVDAQKCFKHQNNLTVNPQCVFEMLNIVTSFLTKVSTHQNEAAFLSILPTVFNTTVRYMGKIELGSNPDDILESILSNIKRILQLNQQNNPELMKEITMVEDLIQLFTNMEPFEKFNSTLLHNSLHAQKAFLELVGWYLPQLEHITRNSSISEYLHEVFIIIRMQVAAQLAQTEFYIFVSDKIETLMNSLQYPLDGSGLNAIAQTTVEILQSLLGVINSTVEEQGYFEGSEGMHSTEVQIRQYLELIEKWIEQPNLPMTLNSLLQWGNSSMATSTPVRDIHFILQTLGHFLSEDPLTNMIKNLTGSLSEVIIVAAQPGGLQSETFVASVFRLVHRTFQILDASNITLPPSAQEDILEILEGSLNLLINQNMSFASSRNISLNLLMKFEQVFQQTLPEEFTVYLYPALKFISTYFEGTVTSSGPNQWNEIIFKELKTIRSFLASNSNEYYLISALINITDFILTPAEGEKGSWATFDDGLLENLPESFGELGKLLNMLLQLFTGSSTSPSLESFADFVPVMEQVMTGNATQETWNKFEQMLGILLSILEENELWNNITSVMPLFEQLSETVVKNIQAENDLIQSLQMPLMSLVNDIGESLNNSHLNISELTLGMQFGIEYTLQEAQQANGTLNCREALKGWERLRAAVGLNRTTLSSWCDSLLLPVLQNYAAAKADIFYLNLNVNHMAMEPMSASTAAGRIAKTIQSLYHVSINGSDVMQQFIRAFSSQVSMLTGSHLSYEATDYLYMQLQDMQLQNSVHYITQLSDELLEVAPFLRPYVGGSLKALTHFLENYIFNQPESSSQELVEEAVMIFLTSANITTSDLFSMTSGNASVVNVLLLANTMEEAIKLMISSGVLGESFEVYQVLETFLASNGTYAMVDGFLKLLILLSSSNEHGLSFVSQILPQVNEMTSPLLLALNDVYLGTDTQLYEDLAKNVIAMIDQIASTGGPLLHQQNMVYYFMGESMARHRQRRDLSQVMLRDPINDFIDLLYIDYQTLFRAVSVPPTPNEILETAHVFFANPDLNIVMKGATSGMGWNLNASREATIDAALGMFSFLTYPNLLESPPLDILTNAAKMLPDGLPLASEIKNITSALARESQGNLVLMRAALQTIMQLFQISPTDPQLQEQLSQLRSQMCTLEENAASMRVLMQSLNLQPGDLCDTLVPGLQFLANSLHMNTTSLSDIILQAVIGDPLSYNIRTDWSSILSEVFGFNMSSLGFINITAPGVVTVGEMLRNESAFFVDVQQHINIDPATLVAVMDSPLPSNLQILSLLVKPLSCSPSASMNLTDAAILETFCSMSSEDLYKLILLVTEHANTEKVIFRMVLSQDLQSLAGVMVEVAKIVTDVMNRVLPAVNQLQSFLSSVEDLDLVSTSDFKEMKRSLRTTPTTKATFVTLSRALCSKGIIALFGISKLPQLSDAGPSFSSAEQRDEMIDRFKIPRDATPFCMNMYLDMVNTTGGAIAWAFLKPMLMGEILYTPDTPTTRAIMEKANATLHEFGNLKKSSDEWIKSSENILNSAGLLKNTLPLLQNALSNSFVKNFIEMQTDINVDSLKEALNSFSNITELLQKNKNILDHITSLSNLMVKLSSCVKFDRYRGYDSEDKLNTVAQELAKNRELYASVIFKLSGDSSNHREARSASPLPPKVSYTIRMHMDNVMRTDRVRNPYFVKDRHISPSATLRYNRGFVYLQENIDRAIIETQVGQKVTEPAVQLQPFPYPCFHRDEYLEAIAFVFPLLLMIPWVLFVADFVKKLVHERELRLHGYMKMMGVNPLSHFFAWFLECAAFLLLTIIFLTLVLKYGDILPKSDGFLIFLYLCDFGFSILSFTYLVSSFFDKTYIAGLSGSLLYILCFFPFIMVMALERNLSFSQKSALSLFAPTCFSYASQYITRYEAQGEGLQWSNSYSSPIAEDTASFGWLCWLLLIDSLLYFMIGSYIRVVFPGKYGIPAPWYFPFKRSFWTDLCFGVGKNSDTKKGLLFSNIMQKNPPVFSNSNEKGKSALTHQAGEEMSEIPVGVTLHGLSKIYGDKAAIQDLNVSFYEGHVTSLLGHNGAGKTTTMSLLTGLFAPTSGSIEVYGKDMQTNIEKVRKELGVCMQYDVLFNHMTTKEHLLMYGQIKAPHWTERQLREQVRTILEETGMYTHRHKRVDTLSGGMRRKLSIAIAFIGGSRLVVLDEPTTGVDPCSRRSIWDIIIQHKKERTIIMSTHHLDEAEVLSDRIAFLEQGGLKCCGSPFYLKDKLGQGYKLTLTKKIQSAEAKSMDSADLKAFIQAHLPEARLKDTQCSDVVYSLPPFTSSNASSFRSLLTALDANLDDLQLGGYGISDTTLEEVFLQLTHGDTGEQDEPIPASDKVSDTVSLDSFSSDTSDNICNIGDKNKLSSTSKVSGLALAWQQLTALLTKRFHHSRRDWKGMISQILLPVLFVVIAMALGTIKSDLYHYPEMELSPALYNIGPSNSFFSNQNQRSSPLVDTMMSYPGMDNACLDKSDDQVCTRSTNSWSSSEDIAKPLSVCKCTRQEQICQKNNVKPPHKKIPSSQIVYNLTGFDTENYLVATANDFIRNRYGGFAFGMPLPRDLQMDLTPVPKNRTLSKVWFNPEGHHTMPAYLNSLNNLILRSNIPADKDPQKYGISVSSHPYFGRKDDEDAVVEGMLQIIVAMCVLTGFSITTSSFAIYEVNEHNSGSKRLQHISGISEPLYWTVNFFYDMVIYMIPVTMTICVIAAFQVPAFTDRQNLGAVSLLFVLFGFATFPWMYLISGLFKDTEKAFITYVCINLFLSVNTIMSTSVLYFLEQITSHNKEIIHDILGRLSNAFLIFPQFNFGNGLMSLARNNIEVQILSGYGIDAYKDPFSTEGLGWMFISSLIQGFAFFMLRLLINKSLMHKIRHLLLGRKTLPQDALEEQDEDVATEHLRVASGAASSDLLQINQLTKIYQHLNRKVAAVKKLSVGIPAGECFGLLGVNGAGKTTTFKMLTGDVSPTEGSAQIMDKDGQLVDIMECRYRGINIGYCPQVDALDSLLTGEEHLYFYARIRGISKREIDGVVNYLLKRLELNRHRNIITDGYSCGTRRKLSTALALIGHPQILLLDEPSSGMDPRTKRHLWKIISEEVKGQCAVVLTSHSMEECEALCSRLAIMVKGQFRCLGSLQHIKNRFGSGFTVKMYLYEPSRDAKAITAFMQGKFPCTYLKDQHSAMVEYHVPNAPGGVADIFNQLESNKNALRIKHFSVSQTTLDEVFINFATENIGIEDVGMETLPNRSGDDFEDLDSLKTVKI